MKSRSRHNSKNKGFMIFFTMTLQPFINYHSTPCFPSRNITKNVETHPPVCVMYILNIPISPIMRVFSLKGRGVPKLSWVKKSAFNVPLA